MGEVFAGRYELVDLIGSGGMGAVWRVWDRRAETHLAAKVLQQRDSASLLRFVREQAVRIHDPHVVTPLGWAGEDDRVLFTMPLVRGGSVATLIGDFGALPQHWVAELLGQLLGALAAVHRAAVVHRDVKPGNLLLEPTGRARPYLRLTDFGIAVPLGEPRLTSTGVVVGTAGYLAPETFEGAEPAPTQDVYAAGRVAVAMLTGSDAGGPVPTGWADGVDPALASLVERLAARDPSDRPVDGSAAVALASSLDLPCWVERDDGIEVFDQLAALPAGSPHQTAVLAAAATAVDDASPVPPRPSVADPAEAAVEPAETIPAAGQTVAAASRPPRQGTGRSVGRWAVAVAVLLVLAGAGALWITRPSSNPTTTRTTPTQPTQPRPSPTEAVTPPLPTISVGPATGTDSAGDACSFADVGVRETSPDGRVVSCQRQADGAYRWAPAG